MASRERTGTWRALAFALAALTACAGASALFAQGGTAPPIAVARRGAPKLPHEPDAAPPIVVPGTPQTESPATAPQPAAPPRLKP